MERYDLFKQIKLKHTVHVSTTDVAVSLTNSQELKNKPSHFTCVKKSNSLVFQNEQISDYCT